MGFREPPKGAPEKGASHGYQCRHQRQAWNTKAATAATKKAVCKHKSLYTPPLPWACAARHCQGPVIQGQLPRENTQCTSGCCNVPQPLPLQARLTFHIPPPPTPRPEWATAPYSAATLTPPCLSEEQMPSGDLHAEVGPNPKLNPRNCANKEEKGNFLSQQPQEQWIKSPQSTGYTLHLWNTWIHNKSSQN